MDQFLSFPFQLSVFLFFLFMLVKSLKKPKAITDKSPPGPPKLPLIGNLHQLITNSLSPPHHTLANIAKKYGPVMHLQLGTQIAVVISSPEAAKEVLKTKEVNFSQRPEVLAVEVMAYNHPGLLFAPYGDYWRQMRRICVSELLSTNRVQSFRSIREEEVWNVLESISSSEGVAVNLSEKICSLANNVISQAEFGKKCKDQNAFTSLIGETMEMAAGFNLADLYPSLKFLRYITGIKPAMMRIHKKLDKILDDIINEHGEVRNKPTDSNNELHHEDLLDVLSRLQDPNEFEIQLTTDHIKAVTMDIFFAGSETSATTLEWAMSELVKNPRVMEKTQAELRQAFKGKMKIEEADIQTLDYLKLVIKETLRMHPPGPLLPRESIEKTEIFGYEIPAKAKVIINVWAIGRDPTIWVEPDCFKPERFQDSSVDFRGANFELLPFGAGRRICPGISFAIAEIQLALAQLLYHFDWKLADGKKLEELDMNETFGATIRRKHNLRLIATTRVPFRK